MPFFFFTLAQFSWKYKLRLLVIWLCVDKGISYASTWSEVDRMLLKAGVCTLSSLFFLLLFLLYFRHRGLLRFAKS